MHAIRPESGLRREHENQEDRAIARHFPKSIIALVTYTLCLFVSGCGGGGGGGSSVPLSTATFTITGDVVATGGTAADGDVNDPAAPYVPNDTLATPQDIPNPVNVGGYVNQPGSGEPGRSQLTGDATDLYRIAVVAGQRITLIIGDSTAANDLDLFLGDTDGNLIDSSEGVSDVETLVPAVTGTYLIEVHAFQGASNYILTVGQEATPGSSYSLSVLDDFVPGEVLARFKDVSGAGTRAASVLSEKSNSLGMAVKAGALDREVLLRPENAGQAGNAKPALNAGSSQNPQPVLMKNAGIDPRKIETIRAIKALRHSPDIKYADPNYMVQPSLTPNDNAYPLQWHYPMINLPQAWDITTGDDNVIVAVIDTGVLLSHPDLQGRLIQGYDFIRSPVISMDGDGIDSNPDDPGDLNNNGSSTFHGTHVAGTIGAATNNMTGVSGTTWSTSIMPLRVLGALGGDSYDVMQAVRYAAGLPNDSGTVPARMADVINLSLGCADPCLCSGTAAEQDVYTQVRNKGIIVVAAAGNAGSSCLSYPASYNGVVSVSAVDINRSRASYSNFGTAIDVAAPGGDSTADINGDGYPDFVLSTSGDDSSGSIQLTYTFNRGTSMAAPHVAGVVALMKAVDPALTPGAFDTLLSAGQLTADLGAAGRDDLYGHGLIDAHKAVVAAGGMPIAANLVASPASLNFGAAGTTLSLSLENGGEGTLTVNAPADDASWLTVTQGNVDVNNTGTYTATVSRSGLQAGTYTATITVASSANTVSIPVIMQVSSIAVSADAGFQHILLIDPVTGDTIDEVETSASNGRYSYSFTGVPGGNYQIIAGSDSNNDFFICDTGESCGAYLTIDQPSQISVDADLSLSDFQTGYIASFTPHPSGSGGTSGQAYGRLDGKSATRRLQQ